VSVTAVDAAGKTITVVDEEGNTSKVSPTELKATDKKHRAKPGNPVEINSQGDGATVAIKEEKEEGYVNAKIGVEVQGVPAGTTVQIKALDYTSKADGDNIDIILPNKKLAQVKKKDVKLFEAGVYNSETDMKNNPKTKENQPDEVTGKLDTVLDGVENLLAELTELKTIVDSDTKFSSDTLEKCIAELNTYKKSLSEEKTLSNSATVEA
jgi:hypothetical protein